MSLGVKAEAESAMKKVVLKIDAVDDLKKRHRVLKIISGISGVDSISMDMKERRLTATGDVDPAAIVSKLRKVCLAEIISVGPVKERKEEAKAAFTKHMDDGGKDKKKDEPLRDQPSQAIHKNKEEDEPNLEKAPKKADHLEYDFSKPFMGSSAYGRPVYVRSVEEEDPNSCTIC